ncbi:hypothetical protein N865_06675 [Intrasporangium oryzae NRRL B-24470]|uniref:Lipoprotein n=1 Tax=Intrasporangium oryzae NRRL B-24470 TaxID=1386089 RepID=W9G890_9MICO|nr:hypothetical protein [Intrasporangium oryzae]EWT02270.1 hypothetical protein N865_06675 [Intrasporangium oryzae NRRL B-24470]
MPSPATRRRGLAALLLGVTLLSACTGNADEGDVAESTPAVAPSAAQAQADSVVAAAVTARNDITPAGEAARQKAFAGAALESANAWAKTLPGRTAADKAANELSTTGAKVLGISRSTDLPQQILVQTTLVKSGAPVLVLLTTSKAGTPFKVAALVPVLPGARVDALDPLSEGSGAIGSGKGLVATPDAVVKAYADSVKYPDPVSSPLLDTDKWTQQLVQSARAQGEALKVQGTFTQTHDPKAILGGLRLKGGDGAIVFADLVRSDAIALRTPAKLTPSKDLTLLTGIKQITTEADLTTNEIIAFVIPTTGKARIVAATDQLVAGTGR